MPDHSKIYRKEMLNQLFLELAEVVSPETRTPKELELRRDIEKHSVALALIRNKLENTIDRIEKGLVGAPNPTLEAYKKILDMVESIVKEIYA